MPIERKYERDVDLLLAEEFKVNSLFADRFKSLTKFKEVSAIVADVFVSKSNNLGESDLVVIYEADGGERFALYIEDKVDAPLQPEQAARYRQRADQESESEVFYDYEILLCAPQFYIENHPQLDGFDHIVSLEKIAQLIRTPNDLRSAYRADFLESVSSRRVNTWQREDDIATNDFWNAAYRLATKEFQILEMKEPTLTKGSNWITFRPHDFPTMPKGTYIAVKGYKGYVDLTFSNTAAYLFEPEVKSLLEPDMTIHKTGKSAAIRIETESFLVGDGIENGLPKVQRALYASARLVSFYRTHKERLNRAAIAATAA